MTPCGGGCYTGDNGATTRLYPEVRFTCNGTVTKWRAAARQLSGSKNTVLWIWREMSSGSQTYRRISTQSIELGVCGSGIDASPVAGMNGVYECTLPESSRVTVQSGDIIGTEVAASSELGFGLLYDNSRGYGPLGYIFDVSVTTAMLGPNNNRPNEIPLLSLTVEPITETATTTEPEPQTEGTTMESRETTTIYTNSDATASTAIDITSSQTTTTPASGISFVEDNFPKELIIGALVTGLVMIALLIAIAFVLAYLSRRVGTRDGEGRPGPRKHSNLKKDMGDMEYNEAYIPQILVKDNVAYGQGANLYTVEYDTILDIEPGNLNTLTREVSVSNVYSSVP